MKVTRVSEGMEGDRRLGSAGIRRLMSCLREFDREVREAGGKWLRGVATSAFRRAENGDEILRRVATTLDIPRLEVISGEREAERTARGALGALSESAGTVLDIGGSSTELVVRASEEATYSVSMPVGVVRLYEQAGTPETWSRTIHRRMRKSVSDELTDHPVPNPGECPFVVVGGTGTTFAALRQDHRTYRPNEVHGFRAGRKEITEMIQFWYEVPFEQVRVREPVVQQGREDVFFAGLVILESVLDWAEADGFTVSDFGLLAGVLDEELGA